MITYVDTSTLVKLLVAEAGSEAAGRIWDESDVLIAVRLAHVEARAALGGAVRRDRLATAAHRTALRTLEVLWAQVAIVEIDDTLMRRAGDVAVMHGLRGDDSTHLAAALHAGADVFSSADDDLCRAATAAGLYVANPVA